MSKRSHQEIEALTKRTRANFAEVMSRYDEVADVVESREPKKDPGRWLIRGLTFGLLALFVTFWTAVIVGFAGMVWGK